MWKWEAEGDAKAVIIMIHGAMEHHGRYGWVIEQWRSAGFHVIMGDLPGQGMTSRVNRGHIESFDEYLLEVQTWLQAAYEQDLPVFLLGHDLGGLIAIRLIQENKLNIAGVILSSPTLGFVYQPSKSFRLAMRGINVAMPTYKINPELTGTKATRNQDVLEADGGDSLTVKTVSVRWYIETIEAIEQAFEKIDSIQDVPMLLMQSGDEQITDKKAVKDWFNHVALSEKRYKEWPKLYHEIFNEPERKDVFQYALDFVLGQLKAIGYVYE
ncbi:alpha/beta hydrolase [Mesobacillus maritimus]|uniref:alpha/beta fold hydrolase n=1 Tax=Mesobacillus maritimus TaxID=1643336 RepID=UPI00203CE8F3|nr:alpha/beta hydrolase [Mesobacillus maritimus]MCM3587963.1 alpha/beta hydrolase [Mesobacillus maritimus]